MWSTTLVVSLLLSSHVHAGISAHIPRSIRRDNRIEDMARRFIDDQTIDRREASPPESSSSTWGNQTQAACTAKLAALNGVASNPAGMAVCYNIPSLNTTDGSFYADLRLYMIAAPTGDFAGIPAQDVTVSLNYPNATVSLINDSMLMRRDEKYSMVSWPAVRSEGAVQKRASAPVQVQAYAFYGRVNMSLVKSGASTPSWESLVTPAVSLAANASSGGAIVKATLSSDEAAFLTGAFTSTVAATTPTAATMKGVAAKVLAPGTPFSVPGTKILIFPIGAIVTGVWALLLIVGVAWGTVGRYQFREQYRRQTARAAEKAGRARI